MQQLLFLVLNGQEYMLNLGYKHSTDGKSYRVSRELVLLLNVIAFQVNIRGMLLKSMGLLQNVRIIFETEKITVALPRQHSKSI